MGEQQRYPLHWPEGQPRVPAHERTLSRYEVSQEQAQRELFHELRLMGAKDIILSTNVELRRDGKPYSRRRPPDDPGVALYWTTESGVEVAIGSDQFRTVRENIRALGKTVECLRGVDRAGCTSILEMAYRGFAQLPAHVTPAPRPWWRVLGFESSDGLDMASVKRRFRELSRTRHPDRGGSHEAMSELNQALADAKKALT